MYTVTILPVNHLIAIPSIAYRLTSYNISCTLLSHHTFYRISYHIMPIPFSLLPNSVATNDLSLTLPVLSISTYTASSPCPHLLNPLHLHSTLTYNDLNQTHTPFLLPYILPASFLLLLLLLLTNTRFINCPSLLYSTSYCCYLHVYHTRPSYSSLPITVPSSQLPSTLHLLNSLLSTKPYPYSRCC